MQVRNFSIDEFCLLQKNKKIDKDFVEKQLNLIAQPFEFNQENSKEENFKIKVEPDAKADEEHPKSIAVDDGVPDITKD